MQCGGEKKTPTLCVIWRIQKFNNVYYKMDGNETKLLHYALHAECKKWNEPQIEKTPAFCNAKCCNAMKMII
jgi:hypothetical protein